MPTKKPTVKKKPVAKRTVKKKATKTGKAKLAKNYSGKPAHQPPWRRKELNMNQQERDAILAPHFFVLDFVPGRPMQKIHPGRANYDKGQSRFENVSKEVLERLVVEKFANPLRRQGRAPCTQMMINFMTEFPEVRAHGVAIANDYTDYDIVVEGLHVPVETWKSMTQKRRDTLAAEFTRFNRSAVECGPGTSGNMYYSWFDYK